MFEGEHGSVTQLPPQQSCAPAVHEPAPGWEMPGHLHLDRWNWRGSAQQDQNPGPRAKQLRR